LISLQSFQATLIKSAPEELPVPREESLVIAGYYEPPNYENFNPYIPNRANVLEVVLNFEGLWYINYATGEVIYWLCTGWEYNDDYTQLTIHIRRGVKWNDGEPFTAKDVVFTLNMLLNNEALLSHAMIASYVESAQAPDDYTVVIKLKSPYPRAHYWFRDVWQGFITIPEHIWKNVDPTKFLNNPPVSTGPYKLYKASPELHMVIWERNENYWAKDVMGLFPGPKYVVYKILPSVDIAVAEFSRGMIDELCSAWVDWPVLKSLHDTNPETTALATFTDPCLHILRVNCQKYPFNMTEFRWALSYAIDRVSIGRVYTEYTSASPAKYPFPSWPSLRRYMYRDIFEEKYKLEYNEARAKEILDSLGFKDVDGDGFREYPNGTKFSFEILYGAPWRVNYEYALSMTSMLQKVGLDASIRPLEPSTWWSKVSVGDYDATTSGGLCTGLPYSGDAYGLVAGFHSKYVTPIGQRTTGGDWGARLADPEMDSVIDEISPIDPSHPRYEEVAHKAIEVWMKKLPIIPVTDVPRSELWNLKYWTGFPTNDNMYNMPYYWCPWWMFVLFRLKPSAAPPPPYIIYITAYAKASIAAFTGVDGKTYGPYEAGDAMLIPMEDAERLVDEGKATYSPPVPAEIGEIAESVSDLHGKVSRLESTLAGISASTADLSSAISNLKASVEALSGQIASVTTTVAVVGVVTIILVIAAIMMIMRKK
jgi:peptide/nickel transport system substrate-binding protein